MGPVLLALGMLASGAAVVGPSAAASPAASPAAVLLAGDPDFAQAWRADLGYRVGASAPALATIGGEPSAVYADRAGKLNAFLLAGDGMGNPAVPPGWPASQVQTDVLPSTYPSSGVSGPVSAAPVVAGSDESRIYVQSAGGNNVHNTSTMAEPQVALNSRANWEAFESTGVRLFHENPWAVSNTTASVPKGSTPTRGGITLFRDGGWKAITSATDAHYFYGIDPANGDPAWSFLNSDSMLTTPAVVKGPKSDTLVAMVTDQSCAPDAHGNRSNCLDTPQSVRDRGFVGGHVRMFTPAGAQVCNRNFLDPNPNDAGTGSVFGSSPAYASLGSVPMVITGQGRRWDGSNKLLYFNTNCELIRQSPQLDGPTVFSPTIADLDGDGEAEVIIQVGDTTDSTPSHPTSSQVPVVYVFESSGALRAKIRISGCIDVDLSATSQSVVTADLRGDGGQDLIVSAGRCGWGVFDGETFVQFDTKSPICGSSLTSKFLAPPCSAAPYDKPYQVRSTALVTEDPDGNVGITVDGTINDSLHGAEAGSIYHYVVSAGEPGSNPSLGQMGWPQFHHDSQLTGVADQTFPAPINDVLGQGHSLTTDTAISPISTITSADGLFRASIQGDGNFVFAKRSGSSWITKWSSATGQGAGTQAGARVAMQSDGNLVVYDASNQVRWSSGTAGATTPSTLSITSDGTTGRLVLRRGPVDTRNGAGARATASVVWSKQG